MKASLYCNYRRYRCIRCNKDVTSSERRPTISQASRYRTGRVNKPEKKDKTTRQNTEGLSE